ncbi:hypothetical protein EG834_03770 [bacterium]|nr:hypothetical protein [bacterium]
MRKVQKQGNVYILVEESEEKSAVEARSAHLSDSLSLTGAGFNLEELASIVQHILQRLLILEKQK